MFNDALIIFRKEAGNILRDRASLVANYLLPLLLMPVIFGVLGVVTKVQTDSHEQTVYQVAFAGPRDSGFEKLLGANLQYTLGLEPGSPDGVTVTFAPGHTAGASGAVEVAYDSSRQDLSYAGQAILTALQQYNQQLAEQSLLKNGLDPTALSPLQTVVRDLAAPEVQGAQMIAFMLPYVIMLMLFAGSMGLGLAVTTGEKEKGSLAGLLVNQVSRTSIAVGKILFVLVSAMINAITSAIGIMGGLLLQGFLAGDGPFQMGSLGALGNPANFAVLVVTVMMASVLAASVIVWIGVMAKSMKEAGGYITPVYIIVIVGAIAGSSMDTATAFWLHLVPLLNSALVIKAAILGALEVTPVLMAFGVNLLAGGVLIALTARAFESENVLATVS